MKGDAKNSLFSRFMAVLWAIAHCFGSRGDFKDPSNWHTIERRRQKLIVFKLDGRFVRYCTLFCGPRAISKTHETWYVVSEETP
jgi:hypothetical protein